MKCSKKISRIAVMLGVSLLTALCLVFAVFAAGDWFTDKKPVDDYAFSFVLVGDTQNVTKFYPDKLSMLYDWLLDNREEKKIEYVFGLGDITNDSTTAEWEAAKEQIFRLNGKIPYSLVRGNHDTPADFKKYLDEEAYTKQFEGFYRRTITNSYRTFSTHGVDFLMITLDFGPSDQILNWASELIEAHPNHKVIITTHAYLTKDGTTLDHQDKHAPTPEEDGQGVVNNGDDMWDKLISKHENIFLVISGHISYEMPLVTQTVGEKGNVVTQMLVDTQNIDKSQPAGIVVMLYFKNDGTTISVEQYSTIQQKFYMASAQFDMTVPAFFSTSEETTENTTEDIVEETTAEETTTLPEETETTVIPETAETLDAADETTTESAPAESGCKSSIGGMSMIAVLPVMLSAFWVRTKKYRR